MQTSPEYEGIFQNGVHIVHEKETNHIRITCNFGQISLNHLQAKTLGRFLSEFIQEMEMRNDD